MTLPIHQADPTLGTPAAEYAAATARLVGGEKLTESAFVQLTATLRPAVAAAQLGRSGQRVVLTRHDASQSFEELTLNQQLGALCIHPKLRRALGFGWADRRGLVAGDTYVYRVTGRFEAADLTDRIYDFHLVPSSTVLPAAFSIGNLGVRTQLPASVVLEPAPASGANNGASRRGIRIDATAFDDSWLLPSFGEYSAVLISRAGNGSRTRRSRAPLVPLRGRLAVELGQHGAAAVAAGTACAADVHEPDRAVASHRNRHAHALRLPAGGSGVVTVAADTPPIRYAPEPLPLPPSTLSIANLQEPLATLTGTIDESTGVQPRPPAGFRLTWLPETVAGVPLWPPTSTPVRRSMPPPTRSIIGP